MKILGYLTGAAMLAANVNCKTFGSALDPADTRAWSAYLGDDSNYAAAAAKCAALGANWRVPTKSEWVAVRAANMKLVAESWVKDDNKVGMYWMAEDPSLMSPPESPGSYSFYFGADTGSDYRSPDPQRSNSYALRCINLTKPADPK